MKNLSIFVLFLFLFIYGCFKEDERVAPYAGKRTIIPDSVQTYRSYFDLETDSVIKTHASKAWQLGFEAGSQGWRIVTNSGAGWFIFNTGLTESNDIQMPAKIDHLYDIQSLWPDSTAVGKWLSVSGDTTYSNHIYLLGQYSGNRYIKWIEVRFMKIYLSHYLFSYRDRQTGNSDTVTVPRDERYNFIYYDFLTHDVRYLEPEKTAYDLTFESYYDVATLFNQTMPYKVGGALLNSWNTFASVDSTTAYPEIDYEMATSMDFTQQRDIPGYRWKTPTIDVTGGGGATYDVKSYITYVFRTSDGNYYKLRFLSYTLNGMSGFPQFEFARLQPGP